MVRLNLRNEHWTHCGNTLVRGYAHLDRNYLAGVELARTLDASASLDEFEAIVARLNGCFAVVKHREGALRVAVDRIRSIPLFYSLQAGQYWLTDNADEIRRSLGHCEPNATAQAEFRLTGYVTGNETLCDGICQIEAGELVDIDAARPNPVERRRYHRYHHRDFRNDDPNVLITELDGAHRSVFQRLLHGIEGRTIVVPLSGGYDSRLIGVSLRDLGVRNVICYSYGVPGNWESRISQELARHLGFQWEFIPYSAERWRRWAGLDEFRAYFRTAGNLASVPHIQDWPAVYELQRDHKLPPDSVFVPGHSGDFIAGSHIPKWYVKRGTVRRKEFFESIFNAHYSLWDWPIHQASALRGDFERRIEAIVGAVSDCSAEQAADLFERWDLQERQAKFICNSVRVYESFGYDWRLPLFDHELMDFWQRIPIEQRTARKLYFEFVRQRQDLPITPANQDHSRVVDWVLRTIERLGLRPAAKQVQRQVNRLLWKRQYERSPLAWYALFDPEVVRRTYTGNQLFYSYSAGQYHDLVMGGGAGPAHGVRPS